MGRRSKFRDTETWQKMDRAMRDDHFPACQRLIKELFSSEKQSDRKEAFKLVVEIAPYFFPKKTHQMNEMIAPAKIEIINRAKDGELDDNAKPKED